MHAQTIRMQLQHNITAYAHYMHMIKMGMKVEVIHTYCSSVHEIANTAIFLETHCDATVMLICHTTCPSGFRPMDTGRTAEKLQLFS